MDEFPGYLGDPDWEGEPQRSHPHHSYGRPYSSAGESEERVRRTLDPQTAFDRLVRKWALVAVVWLAIAEVADLRQPVPIAGLIACLLFFLIGAARLR